MKSGQVQATVWWGSDGACDMRTLKMGFRSGLCPWVGVGAIPEMGNVGRKQTSIEERSIILFWLSGMPRQLRASFKGRTVGRPKIKALVANNLGFVVSPWTSHLTSFLSYKMGVRTVPASQICYGSRMWA